MLDSKRRMWLNTYGFCLGILNFKNSIISTSQNGFIICKLHPYFFCGLIPLNFLFIIPKRRRCVRVELGEKIKRLRLQHGLTQEELALRCDLSKGFISQLERDLTSPSIATLMDVLECLGSDLKAFFNDDQEEKIVFGVQDVFDTHDEDKGLTISWLIPNAQKNQMEPILLELAEGGATVLDDPHAGEEFGYVLSGQITIRLGDQTHKCKKGESFYFKPTAPHRLENHGKLTAKVLWVSSPPTF